MKYQISLVIASAFFSFILFALAYWGFKQSLNASLALGISSFITGVVVEWLRPLFIKKKVKR
jgi:hypothetical protein